MTRWKPAKRGGFWAPALDVRAGNTCTGIVKEDERKGGWYFGLRGRRGAMLCKWQSGFDTAPAAMKAAEEMAATVDNV